MSESLIPVSMLTKLFSSNCTYDIMQFYFLTSNRNQKAEISIYVCRNIHIHIFIFILCNYMYILLFRYHVCTLIFMFQNFYDHLMFLQHVISRKAGDQSL